MEEINEILSRGFGVWKRNLNLCVPFLLNVLVSMLILVPFLVAISLTLLPREGLSGLNEITFQNETALQGLLAQMSASLESLPQDRILLITGLFLALIVLISLVSAMFTAGAIGMARQALEKGRSDLGVMWSAARSYFVRLFLATLLMGLFTVAGLIFLLPPLLVGSPSIAEDPLALGLLGVGLLLFIFYALAISVILAVAPYALVVEDLGPVQAISASIAFFRYNKFDVAVLWLVIIALSLGLEMIGGVFSTGQTAGAEMRSAIINLVDLLVLYPLSNLWWTRLYMSRKGMLLFDEVKDSW
jgi:hypothetical protein